MARIKSDLPATMQEGQTLVSLMRAAQRVNSRQYRRLREEVLPAEATVEYDLRPGGKEDWHMNAVQEYLGGLGVKAIAEKYRVSQRAVIHAFERLLARHKDEPDPPGWFDRLAQRRAQATHGGERG